MKPIAAFLAALLGLEAGLPGLAQAAGKMERMAPAELSLLNLKVPSGALPADFKVIAAPQSAPIPELPASALSLQNMAPQDPSPGSAPLGEEPENEKLLPEEQAHKASQIFDKANQKAPGSGEQSQAASLLNHASEKLADIQLKNGRLYLGKEKVNFLDRPRRTKELRSREPAIAFHSVHDHPLVPGAVIKIDDVNMREIWGFLPHDNLTWYEFIVGGEQTASENEARARQLAEVGAGPRPLGQGTITMETRGGWDNSPYLLHGYPVRVSEKVYGETVENLIRKNRFGRHELLLVDAMVRQLAEARLSVDFKRLSDIMIGHTLLNTKRQAYIVNEIPIHSYVSSVDPPLLATHMLMTEIPVKNEPRSLYNILTEAADRSLRKTLSQRVKGYFQRSHTPEAGQLSLATGEGGALSIADKPGAVSLAQPVKTGR